VAGALWRSAREETRGGKDGSSLGRCTPAAGTMTIPSRALTVRGSQRWMEVAVLCWTRMQTEAGQALHHIVARKEAERRASAGTFFWGVGNAPPSSLAALSHAGLRIPVLFSVMKSRPKPHDVSPGRVLAWRRFMGATGTSHPLPHNVLVTSRATTRSFHYALVCRSEEPLSLEDLGPFDPGAYRNFGGTGAPIGHSQVTAILQRQRPPAGGEYRVYMVAELHQHIWVKLLDPVELTPAECSALNAPEVWGATEWTDFVASLCLAGRPCASLRLADQPALFVN
jgi:hypothetical protein